MSDPTPDPVERRSAPRDRRDGAGARVGALKTRKRSVRVQNAVIAVAILAELIWLAGHAIFGGPTLAATPPPLVYAAPSAPSGGDVLLDLAAVAAGQPALTPTARTPYAYVKTVAWHLDAVATGKPPPSRVLPTVTESWLKANGAGRVLTMTMKPKGASIDDAAVGAGKPLPALAPNKFGLARLLIFGRQAPGELVAFTELAGREPISPPVESAILRLLARIPGLIDSGTVIDRYRRSGIAISLDTNTTVFTLIFDQRTGKLLGEEQSVIGTPAGLNVGPGSVIAYTSFLGSGYVASTAAHP